MKNFRSVGYIGIHYVDYSVNPLRNQKRLGTSIPSKIEKKDGSIIGLSKNLKILNSKYYENSFFLPIVGQNFNEISSLDSSFFEILKINNVNSACAVLINNEKGKSASYVDTKINYAKDLNILLAKKIKQLKFEIQNFHIMYADNMDIRENIVEEIISRGNISIDFCRSNAGEIFSREKLKDSIINLIKNAKYLFLSDQEDPIYLEIILENKRKEAILIIHSPESVNIYFNGNQDKIINKFFNNNLHSVAGTGDLFASLFLNKISRLSNKFSFEELKRINQSMPKDLLKFLLIS